MQLFISSFSGLFIVKPGPYLGFFVCGGKLGFREISDQYSYKKQPSKIRHYVRKKTFSFPGGGNCPLRPPAMYGPENFFQVVHFSQVSLRLVPQFRKATTYSEIYLPQAVGLPNDF